MHFDHILHFKYLLRRGQTRYGRHDFGVLARAWREAGRPARTAGAFCAILCHDVPPVPQPPRLEVITAWLSGWRHELSSLPMEPPFTPEVFESHLAGVLAGYRFEEMQHWFRFGQAPVAEAGEQLAADLLTRKPRSLEGVLAEVSRHDRLAGAVPYVTQLVGALSLPPRRLFDHELPVGGYSDVTTRGQPDALLPSQFALDETEFLRRHAQNELLYYRREEPSSKTREELLVVLDQGVRTWGRVRLTLAACVFALGQLAQRRRIAFQVATTGNGGAAIDPVVAESALLAELLSASDLWANPALALENALLQPHDGMRDVVLLTHPRNLVEPDVAAAARCLPRGDRLFAVAVDGHGEVRFHELRHGAPVTLGRFHLSEVRGQRSEVRGQTAGWVGDCEAVGFPFRFGVGGTAESLLFAFDAAGDWLLIAWQHGMLLAARTDGSAHELLPRPMVNGRVLADVHLVIGVAGGFVVAGAVPGTLAAAHYDFSTRQVRLHEFPCTHAQLIGGFEWRYQRSRHALLLRAGEQFHAVRLDTGQRDLAVPAELRWQPMGQSVTGELHRYPLGAEEPGPERPGWMPIVLTFDATTGVLGIDLGEHAVFGGRAPYSDGRPALVNRKLVRAACQRGVLAALFTAPGPRKELWLFDLAGGIEQPTATISLPYDRDAFGLSPDGRLLAVQRGACQLEVRDSGLGGATRCVTPVGRYHNNAVVEVGEQWLALAIERTVHIVEWTRGELRRVVIARSPSLTLGEEAGRLGLGRDSTRARPGRLPGFLSHDPARFRLAAWSNLIAVIDLYGQTFLFEQTGELVCAFFAFRQQLAAWMPDGTCLGPEALLGKRETADAARRIGQALALAWERGERTIS
jgi:hypothetical protein